MSILIKGMKMPKSCDECQFCNDGGMCAALQIDLLGDGEELENSWYIPEGYKSDRCPLIELPDHGDLIEKDPLFKKAEELEEAASAEFERYKLGETNWEQTEKAKWRIAHLERIGFKYEIADAPVVIPAERSEE